MSAIVQSIDANKAEAQQELTDGFHLVIDALKLNGLTTVYGVPGIPITDLGRVAEGEPVRALLCGHEQNAGNACVLAVFLTKKRKACKPGGANGWVVWQSCVANATTNCFPMI